MERIDCPRWGGLEVVWSLFETRPALGDRSAARVVVICPLRLNPPTRSLA